jgi:hypothetical protein
VFVAIRASKFKIYGFNDVWGGIEQIYYSNIKREQGSRGAGEQGNRGN